MRIDTDVRAAFASIRTYDTCMVESVMCAREEYARGEMYEAAITWLRTAVEPPSVRRVARWIDARVGLETSILVVLFVVLVAAAMTIFAPYDVPSVLRYAAIAVAGADLAVGAVIFLVLPLAYMAAWRLYIESRHR
jgi:hypothetical protein